MAEKNNEIKIPFKLRLKTWWEGYDLDDVKDRLKAHQHGDQPNDGTTPDAGGSPKDKTSILPWDELRMKVTQLIWGEGYCGPGGRKHIESMSKLLSMNSQMSAIVIGAGLGGPSRVLTEEFGVWITGYELSKDLAKRGMQMSTDAGLSSKAPIHHLDPKQDDPFDRQYDRAFSKEALYCFPDKPKILNDIYNTLKDGGLFLVTDYCLSNASVLEDPDVQKWLKQEPARPFPVTPDDMKTGLEQAGFTIRVNEDISRDYRELIEKSWSKAALIAQELAKKGQEGTDAVKSLMEEAEFWALRAKLLEENKIYVWRFLANKPSKAIR